MIDVLSGLRPNPSRIANNRRGASVAIASPNVSSTVPPPRPVPIQPPGLLLQSWLIDPPASSPLQRQAALLQAALRQATPALRQPPEATLALLLPPRSVLPPRDVTEVAPPVGSLAEVAESVSVPSVTAGQQKAPVPSGLTPGL